MTAPDVEAELARLRAENERLIADLERAKARASAQEQAGNMGLWELDPSTGVGSWSPKMFELYYMAPSGEPPSLELASDKIHPDDLASVQANLTTLMETGSAPLLVFRTHPDIGPVRHLRVAISTSGRAPNSKVFGAVADVTKEVAMQGELELSKRTLEAVYAHSPYIILAIGQDRRISFINRVADGYDIEQVIGAPHDTFMVERDRELVIHTADRVFREGVQEHVELEDITGLRWDTRYAPITDDSGQVESVLVFTLDVTEQRKLEAQMQHAQKLESLGVLAGGIAHDFNNLLVTIMGNADLALLDLPRSSPARESLHEIVTSSHRAADLCRQMLAYSGKGKFIVEAVDVKSLVGEMAHLLEVSISKQVSLRYDIAEDMAPVEADATQLRQIVMNLITNASDAIGPEGGIVTVSGGTVRCDKGYLAQAYLRDDLPAGMYTYLEVSDTGAGMDDETRERMFEPFYTTKEEGRGLGLSAVLGIVRSHRGAVRVYSEPGKGTTIKVLFPTTDEAPAVQESMGLIEDDWQGRGTILVVDDEPNVRSLAGRALNRVGFDVLTATDGVDALAVFDANAERIVGVLLDMTMPRMDGKTTFAELRQRDAGVRVLLTSGYNEQDATSRFAGKGLAGFIQKPYRPTDLVNAVRTLLGDD